MKDQLQRISEFVDSLEATGKLTSKESVVLSIGAEGVSPQSTNEVCLSNVTCPSTSNSRCSNGTCPGSSNSNCSNTKCILPPTPMDDKVSCMG